MRSSPGERVRGRQTLCLIGLAESSALTELWDATRRNVVVEEAAAPAKVALAKQPKERADLERGGEQQRCLWSALGPTTGEAAEKRPHLRLVLRVSLNRPQLVLAVRILRASRGGSVSTKRQRILKRDSCADLAFGAVDATFLRRRCIDVPFPRAAFFGLVKLVGFSKVSTSSSS